MFCATTEVITLQSCVHHEGAIWLPCQDPPPSTICEAQDHPVSQAPPLILKPHPSLILYHSPAVGQTEEDLIRIDLPIVAQKAFKYYSDLIAPFQNVLSCHVAYCLSRQHLKASQNVIRDQFRKRDIGTLGATQIVRLTIGFISFKLAFY